MRVPLHDAVRIGIEDRDFQPGGGAPPGWATVEGAEREDGARATGTVALV